MRNSNYKWTVVGAGAAGIAAVAKLLETGVEPKKLLWIDPFFEVGDLGKHWRNVSSNTKVKHFFSFLQSSPELASHERKFAIHSLDPEKTCQLQNIVEPLQVVTDRLLQKVEFNKANVKSIVLSNNLWCITTDKQSYTASNVILATGAEPKSLDLAKDELAFVDAIDKDKLQAKFDPKHTYAVFGSSHSAFIIIRNLVELGAKKVINFYRSPCKYAIDMGDYYLFDNTGLKGDTARWTRENIDGVLPNNLQRYISTEENLAKYLPQIDKVVYAVGFVARKNIKVGEFKNLHYNPHLGILAPGLFGFGIAYPELKYDKFGNPEQQVGLWKFSQYLENVLPVWMRYGVK